MSVRLTSLDIWLTKRASIPYHSLLVPGESSSPVVLESSSFFICHRQMKKFNITERDDDDTRASTPSPKYNSTHMTVRSASTDLACFRLTTRLVFSDIRTRTHDTAATRGPSATDHVVLNHGQVTWTTPDLATPLLTTTPHQWEDVSAFDRFNVHRCPTRGCGSPVVKVSDDGRHVVSSSKVPLKTRRVGEPCMLNLSRAQTSSRWCGVVVRKGIPAQVSSSSLDHGSKLRAASVKLTYSASMVDRLTDFCLKVRHEIGVSSIKVMNPPIDTRSSLFVAKSVSE
ncbi:uncharacterized protein TNCV_2155661 [Trichonephila clavipes]|nr:uncharacterized protein TNCV_2155661 [Trichonephila clavipes]